MKKDKDYIETMGKYKDMIPKPVCIFMIVLSIGIISLSIILMTAMFIVGLICLFFGTFCLLYFIKYFIYQEAIEEQHNDLYR